VQDRVWDHPAARVSTDLGSTNVSEIPGLLTNACEVRRSGQAPDAASSRDVILAPWANRLAGDWRSAR